MKLLLLAVLLLPVTALMSQSSKKLHNLDKTGLALEGYDPVAYFTAHKATAGSKENAVSYQGVLYYFASPANKELFKKNPEQYQPQYGGWCAYAMGISGEKVEVDPETFKVADGKLFLFYNKYLNNTLKSWEKNEVNLHQKADVNWSKLSGQ